MTRVNFAQRSQQQELLDTRACPYEDYKRALEEVAMINRLTLSYGLFEEALSRFADRMGGRPLKILEVGYGSGDLLRHVYGWSRKRGTPVHLEGIDLDPWARRVAEELTPGTMPIAYRTGDALALQARERYDVILSSFVAHHLSEAELVSFVSWMNGTARLGWVVHDIHRHPITYYSVKALVRLLGSCPMVVNDAPLSVARSFVRADWESVIRQVPHHTTSIRIQWRFPFKYCVLGETRTDAGL